MPRTLVVFVGAVLCVPQPVIAQQASPFQVAGPSFFAIRTADVDAAASWYRRVLGLTEVNRVDAPDGRYSVRILSGRQISVELIRSSGELVSPDAHPGLFKAGLFVDDIEAAHGWLRSLEVSVDRQIFTDVALQARSFVFRDLDQNRIQVFQRCRGPC